MVTLAGYLVWGGGEGREREEKKERERRKMIISRIVAAKELSRHKMINIYMLKL
jgi:hypothetical protein